MESLCLGACTAQGTNTRGYRNIISIVRSWPTHIKQVTRERKKNCLFLSLANAGHSYTKACISQFPGLSLPPQWLGQTSTTSVVSSPSSKDVWEETAQTEARQESSRSAASSSKPGSVSVPQAAASRRVMVDTCHNFTSFIWMKMQILMQVPRYMLVSVITTEVSSLRQYRLH